MEKILKIDNYILTTILKLFLNCWQKFKNNFKIVVKNCFFRKNAIFRKRKKKIWNFSTTWSILISFIVKNPCAECILFCTSFKIHNSPLQVREFPIYNPQEFFKKTQEFFKKTQEFFKKTQEFFKKTQETFKTKVRNVKHWTPVLYK